MRIELSSDHTKDDVSALIKVYEAKHGSLDSLRQKILTEKCTDPNISDEYLIWSSLKDGSSYKESIVFEDAEIVDFFTKKRFELIEFLLLHKVSSITDLSQSLKRNYKNVYDDLKVLSEYNIIRFVERGRSKVPLPSIKRIEVDFL